MNKDYYNLQLPLQLEEIVYRLCNDFVCNATDFKIILDRAVDQEIKNYEMADSKAVRLVVFYKLRYKNWEELEQELTDKLFARVWNALTNTFVSVMQSKIMDQFMPSQQSIMHETLLPHVAKTLDFLEKEF